MATDQQLDEYKSIGSRIKECRLARHMSQAQLADKSGLSLPHISKIEHGKVALKLPTFICITEALQVSADTLLRSNVPEVNAIYQNEFSDLLADCTPVELDSILNIVKEVKRSMRAAKDDNLD